jgi:hypothetical protein
MRYVRFIFVFLVFQPFATALADSNIEHCPSSVRLIFGEGKFKCLSDYPALSEIKIVRTNSTVGESAKKFKIYSFAQNPEYGTKWSAWNHADEDANDNNALTSCQKALDEKLKSLKYKKAEGVKCLLILSSKAPVGSLQVGIPEDKFNEAYSSDKKDSPPTVIADSLVGTTAAYQSTDDINQNHDSAKLNLKNRKALVIGNDTYKSISKLLTAREDARTIATNLNAVGYQVTLKLDLNEKEMKSALRTFAAQVQGGDEVMFFFAGHGVQLGSTNYLLPTDIVGDSEAQVRDEAIQLQRVLDDMSEKKAKFTLAMIDACRDNPFKTTGRAIGGRGLAPTTAATGQMVIFSAGTGQQALDRLNASDKNKNGLFTRVFVQEMQKPNVSIDRVVKSVRNQVAELAKSVGHEQVPAIYDQVLGDFYFKK